MQSLEITREDKSSKGKSKGSYLWIIVVIVGIIFFSIRNYLKNNPNSGKEYVVTTAEKKVLEPKKIKKGEREYFDFGGERGNRKIHYYDRNRDPKASILVEYSSGEKDSIYRDVTANKDRSTDTGLWVTPTSTDVNLEITLIPK